VYRAALTHSAGISHRPPVDFSHDAILYVTVRKRKYSETQPAYRIPKRKPNRHSTRHALLDNLSLELSWLDVKQEICAPLRTPLICVAN
jgi:hypothetical protein